MMNIHETMLVVEDDPNDFTLLGRALVQAGFTTPVRRVEDGERAIAYLAGDPPFQDRSKFPLPSLLLLDLKLPKRSGLEVLQWVKSHPAYKKIPVVILTGSAEPKDVDRAYAWGANSYLVKPWEFRGLVALTKTFESYWGEYSLLPVVQQ